MHLDNYWSIDDWLSSSSISPYPPIVQVEPLEAGGWRDGAGRLVAAMVLLEYQSFDPINVGLKVGIVLCSSSSSPAAAARSDRSHKQIMIITGHNTT